MLLFGFLGVIALWQGTNWFSSLVLEPLDAKRKTLQAARERLDGKKVNQYEQELAARKLGDWAKRGLPPDPDTASALYQNWLIDLAAKADLKETVVTPGRVDKRPRGETYYPIGMTVKAQGNLAAVTKFLADFYAAGRLQRINTLSIESSSREGDPPLTVSMTIEGLSLLQAAPRTTLWDPAIKDGSVFPLPSPDAIAEINKKHLFVRGYNGPPAPPVVAAPTRPPEPPRPPTPPVDTFDVAEHVYLVAAFDKEGVRDAWLYNRAQNEPSVLTEGKPFQVAGVAGTVREIGRDFVTLQMGEQVIRLELGQNLRQVIGRTQN